MTCREALVELVECARRGDGRGLHAEPGRELRTHMAICGACSERWDAERQLTAQLGIISKQASALGSPASRRESLMCEFARHQAMPGRANHLQYARWTVAAAAGLLLAVFIGHEGGLHSRSTHPAARGNGVRLQSAVLYEPISSLSSDASALSSDDFVAIPFTPPLAPGEMVRIVRADMYPETLAGMGVEVDPLAWAGRGADVPVEMVVGEDGIPRAVRITDSNQ
ncbi:MAG TPA: hypothetical protein VG297_10115 [Bryobacteraceae bacterium]|jgi:hypothetical protein|nr:hypothetical protein [Bryobacteraceae bacterium]